MIGKEIADPQHMKNWYLFFSFSFLLFFLFLPSLSILVFFLVNKNIEENGFLPNKYDWQGNSRPATYEELVFIFFSFFLFLLLFFFFLFLLLLLLLLFFSLLSNSFLFSLFREQKKLKENVFAKEI